MFLEDLCQQEERINILESEKAMFQQQIISLKSVMSTSENNIEELEQYGRRLCLYIKSMSVVENETSEDVFNNLLDMCKKCSIYLNMISIAHI